MAIVTIGVGDAANDNKGDSIRDAFIKTNTNFAYLDALAKNLVTESIAVSGNVKLTPSGDEWIYVIDGTGVDKRVALEGTVFTGGDVSGQTSFNDTTASTSKSSGAVVISAGGLGVYGAINASSVSGDSGTITNFGFNVLSGGSGTFTGAVGTGNLTVSGFTTATGNISGLNMQAGKVTATSNVNVGGNIIAASNLWIGNVNARNTITATDVIASGLIKATTFNIVDSVATGNISANNISATTNLKVGWGEVSGNLYSRHVNAGVGAFGNVTVQDIPSNYHVTNKGYVNTVVVAFAIGLGS